MARYKPMQPRPAKEIPTGPNWRYELKFDGYRMLAYMRDGKVELISRGGITYTRSFPKVVQELSVIAKTKSCVLDGELVALDQEGNPRPRLLNRRQGQCVYFAFDLLELNGVPLLDKPLSERYALLKNILKHRGRAQKYVQLSEWFSDVLGLLRVVFARKLEGIVAKLQQSLYFPGKRSRGWLKIKIRYPK